MLLSFKDWVDGAHFYRHEPSTDDAAQPPLDFAVLMFSNGASFLRWLAQISESKG